jgi:hypothetical protein
MFAKASGDNCRLLDKIGHDKKGSAMPDVTPASQHPLQPTVLAQRLFGLPHSASKQQRLPQEVRDMIFDHLDRNELCLLRQVNRSICADVTHIRRREFNRQAPHLGIPDTLGSMLHRQKECVATLQSSDVARVVFDVDAPAVPGKIYYNKYLGEHLIWTRAGQLLGVGPFRDNNVIEILAAGSLPCYATLTSEDDSMLQGICIRGTKHRRILTYHKHQGLRLWRCHDAGAPRFAQLRFSSDEQGNWPNPTQGHFTIADNGESVLYESPQRTKTWRWQVGAGSDVEIAPQFVQFTDKKHRVCVQDGLQASYHNKSVTIYDPKTDLHTKIDIAENVDDIFSFSPCGDFIAFQKRELRYRGNHTYQDMFWAQLYRVVRQQDNRPTLSYVTSNNTNNTLYRSQWQPDHRGSWTFVTGDGHELKANTQQPSLPQTPASDRAGGSATLRSLRQKQRLGSDVHGAQYSIATEIGSDKTILSRQSKFGATHTWPVEVTLADYLQSCSTYEMTGDVWSQDGVSLLRSRTTRNRKIAFEHIIFERPRPSETAQQRLKRALHASWVSLFRASQGLPTLKKFLFPNFEAGYVSTCLAISSTLVVCAWGFVGVAASVVILAMWGAGYTALCEYHRPRRWLAPSGLKKTPRLASQATQA